MNSKLNSMHLHAGTKLLAAATLAFAVNAALAYAVTAMPTQGQRYYAALRAMPDTGTLAAARPAWQKG